MQNPNLVPAVASFFIPGLGQFLKGDKSKALKMLGCAFGAVVLAVVTLGIASPLSLVVTAWAVYDAWTKPALNA